jgi:hypothetical protein
MYIVKEVIRFTGLIAFRRDRLTEQDSMLYS